MVLLKERKGFLLVSHGVGFYEQGGIYLIMANQFVKILPVDAARSYCLMQIKMAVIIVDVDVVYVGMCRGDPFFQRGVGEVRVSDIET